MNIRFSSLIAFFILLTGISGLLITESYSDQSGKTFGNVRVGGNVFVKSAKGDWILFKDDFPLLAATDIKTEKGVVSIQFVDGSLVDVSKETVISIQGLPHDYAIQVQKGSFAFNIEPSASLTVVTPSAKLSIGGKKFVVQQLAFGELKRYMGVVSADGLVTEIKSVSGRIPVTIKGDTKIIAPREKISIDARGKYGVSLVESKNFFIGSDADYKGFIRKPGTDLKSNYVGKVNYIKISSSKGNVKISRNGKKRDLKLEEGILLNDVIETGADSRAKISFIDDSLLTLNEFTKLTVKEFLSGKNDKRGKTVFSIEKGQARSVVGKNELIIHSPTGVAAARGTIIILEVVEGRSRLYVIQNEATFTFYTPDGLSEIIHNVDEGYMFGDGLTEPVPIPPYKLLEDFKLMKSQECDYCQKLDSLGSCVPDESKDPGPCMSCQGGEEVTDDTEDPGSCKKCQGGQVVVDDTEEPGSCKKCQGGQEVTDDTEDPGLCMKCIGGAASVDDTEDPGICQKCENGASVIDDNEKPGRCQKCDNGEVVPDLSSPDICPAVECNVCQIVNEAGVCVPDNSRDPGMCRKCQDGVAVADNLEDPGSCKKCENGNAVADNLEDPGMCRKCQDGVAVADNLEDPGSCKKCENGNTVADNLEDPGMCRKCQDGVAVADNLEDPGSCKKCENGNAVADNLEDPGMCRKCQGGNAVADNLEDPGMCLKCEGGMPVSDNFEDPGLCYKCSGGASVVDDFEPCNDNDICTINDRCFGGSCIGNEDSSPIDPECF
ncbi:MAG: FecR domain-containing protein [Nitrospirae bacterium]|nr:FecR domain-containing protein [Nitrospirota bacterium]